MIARRYAKALLELSIKYGVTEKVKKDILTVGDLMQKKRYFEFFTDRLIKAANKLSALEGMDPLTINFLRLVVANKREEYLYLISREYVALLNKRNNMEDALVSSRVQMTRDQKDGIKRMLEKRLKKNVNLSFRTDRGITGGVCIKYAGKIIDGTISGMLNGYLKQLTGR